MNELGSIAHNGLTVLSGTNFLALPEAVPSPQGRPGRRCSAYGCCTILSAYNRRDTCYAHTPKAHRRRTREPAELRWENHGTKPMRRHGCECDACQGGAA